MTRSVIWLAAVGLCVPIGTALAQDPDVEVIEIEEDYEELDGAFDPTEDPNVISLGAGALGAMDEGFNPRAATGVSWNLRYGYNPVNMLSWEVAYTGATDQVSIPEREVGTVATFLETGAKVNVIPGSPITPIVAGGIGYAAFTAEQQDLASMTVPVAAGLEGSIENLLLGTRLTWRPTFFDQVALSDIGADSWIWTADIGTRF